MGRLVSLTPRAFNPREWPRTHCIGVYVGPKAGLEGAKISFPPGFDPRTVQPVAILYTDCDIPAYGYIRGWGKSGCGGTGDCQVTKKDSENARWEYSPYKQVLSPFWKKNLIPVFPFIIIMIYYWLLFISFFFLYLQIIPPSVISSSQWTCLVGALTVFGETLHRVYRKLQNQTLPRFWNSKTIPLTEDVAYFHHTERNSMILHYIDKYCATGIRM